ncbi:MAG: RdgB/HAM1 family non-canonical purine NTP pyrophosphatase [Gammaproteobacteria bacterium]|nr:RdgB/HAM1 family non-canonical purine NTP pyrophosphatase [Gammaproteobacteria bacterium]
MKTIVMASSNAGKIREIAKLLEGLDVRIVPQSEFNIADADETGTTFEENAVIKARNAVAATGLAAIADDSGLAVNALDGRPGVYSARYAGPGASDDDNIDKLLIELNGVDQRAAAFHCVACYLAPGSDPLLAAGEWHGEILRARRGNGGFGYDPVFLDLASGRASAELTPDEKNARSHRGQALRALANSMRPLLDDE